MKVREKIAKSLNFKGIKLSVLKTFRLVYLIMKIKHHIYALNHILNIIQICEERQKKKLTKSKTKISNQDTVLYLVH